MKRWIPSLLVTSCAVALVAAVGCSSSSDSPSGGGDAGSSGSSGTSGTSGSSGSSGTSSGSSGTSGSSGSSGSSGDAGGDSGGKKALLDVCGGDAECESGACFMGGMGSYCSLRCTQQNAATVCVAPFNGVCNNQGFCKKP